MSPDRLDAVARWAQARPWLGAPLRVRAGRWADHAACKGMDTSLFVPEHGLPACRTAIATCDRCPVAVECGQSAQYVDCGVFGGYSTGQRRTGHQARMVL